MYQLCSDSHVPSCLDNQRSSTRSHPEASRGRQWPNCLWICRRLCEVQVILNFDVSAAAPDCSGQLSSRCHDGDCFTCVCRLLSVGRACKRERACKHLQRLRSGEALAAWHPFCADSELVGAGTRLCAVSTRWSHVCMVSKGSAHLQRSESRVKQADRQTLDRLWEARPRLSFSCRDKRARQSTPQCSMHEVASLMTDT